MRSVGEGGHRCPAVLHRSELRRALDAFPLELSEIFATRRVVAGPDLFAEILVPKQELRRACEVQARGHVMHLREGYIETGGDRKAVAKTGCAAISAFPRAGQELARLDGIRRETLVEQLDLDNFEKAFARRFAPLSGLSNTSYWNIE
jgi:hypothetical protein